MKAKRTYKDSLFRNIFNDKRRLQRIYKALTGKLIPLSDIKITTLRGTFFEDIKNDISFMAGNQHISATASSLTRYAPKWPLARLSTRPSPQLSNTAKNTAFWLTTLPRRNRRFSIWLASNGIGTGLWKSGPKKQLPKPLQKLLMLKPLNL